MAFRPPSFTVHSDVGLGLLAAIAPLASPMEVGGVMASPAPALTIPPPPPPPPAGAAAAAAAAAPRPAAARRRRPSPAGAGSSSSGTCGRASIELVSLVACLHVAAGVVGAASGTEVIQPFYHSNQQLEAYLLDFSRRCGHISRVYSIGESSLGVPMWAVEISDKPNEPEAEPAFKYVANMHGDEPVGRQLLLYFAEWLCLHYLKDAEVTYLVQNVRLHLVPSINPDGFQYHKRNNYNKVDLNRDFPDQFVEKNNDERERQPEVQAVMKWSRMHNFIAGLGFHEGALVANYPWDGNKEKLNVYSGCPDDASFRMLASAYAQAHPTMAASTEFKNGITNGAAWYVLYGGYQDWDYIVNSCMLVTVEMNDKKWPDEDELSKLWQEHRASFLGVPLILAKAGMLNVQARGLFGDFYRILPPGVYEVTVSMSGYKAASTVVMVLATAPTGLHFALEPEARGGPQLSAASRLWGKRHQKERKERPSRSNLQQTIMDIPKTVQDATGAWMQATHGDSGLGRQSKDREAEERAVQERLPISVATEGKAEGKWTERGNGNGDQAIVSLGEMELDVVGRGNKVNSTRLARQKRIRGSSEGTFAPDDLSATDSHDQGTRSKMGGLEGGEGVIATADLESDEALQELVDKLTNVKVHRAGRPKQRSEEEGRSNQVRKLGGGQLLSSAGSHDQHALSDEATATWWSQMRAFVWPLEKARGLWGWALAALLALLVMLLLRRRRAHRKRTVADRRR
eukprot:SM000051S17529  [mRNA]  locus=s51:49125:54313:- [translate_table: standard]